MSTPVVEVSLDGKGGVTFKALTLRQYYAGLAMQGLLAAIYSDRDILDEFCRDEGYIRRHLTGCDAVTRCAVNYADALIAGLDRPTPTETAK